MLLMQSLTIFLTTVAVAIGVAGSLHISVSRCMALFMWHTSFCLIYKQYIGNFSDSKFYYDSGLDPYNEFGVGTAFVQWTSELLVQRLNFSFLDAFILFNMLGVFGLILLEATIKQIQLLTKTPESIYAWIPFLPGISFWSGALGKDGIAFSASMLAVYASLDIQKRVIFLSCGLFFMFLVRPHVALMMAGAAAIAMIAGNKIAVRIRLNVLAAITIFGVIVTPFVMEYIDGNDISSTDDVLRAIESRQSLNLDGGSSIDISEMSLPVQLFTYLYRPLFIDATGMFGIAASFENSMLLILLLSSFSRLYTSLKSDRSFFLVYNLSFFLLGAVIFAMTTANLGLADRQKWMILPGFLMIGIFATLAQSRRNFPIRRDQKARYKVRGSSQFPE